MASGPGGGGSPAIVDEVLGEVSLEASSNLSSISFWDSLDVSALSRSKSTAEGSGSGELGRGEPRPRPGLWCGGRCEGSCKLLRGVPLRSLVERVGRRSVIC